MGCFNDLPNDVIWLILRIPLQDYILFIKQDASVFEAPFSIRNSFGERLSNITCDLALTSKRCLKIVKSKTLYFETRHQPAWLFKKGVLTGQI